MKTALIAVLALAQAAPDTVPSLAARIAALPKDQSRAKSPSLAYAQQLAQAALDACKAKGDDVSVLVTDSAGVPMVSLAGEGVAERTQLISQSKANTVVRYRMASGDVKRTARSDTALAQEIARDPNIGEPRLGAYPLMRGEELVGVLSVSGLADGGNEACAQQAMAQVPLR